MPQETHWLPPTKASARVKQDRVAWRPEGAERKGSRAQRPTNRALHSTQFSFFLPFPRLLALVFYHFFRPYDDAETTVAFFYVIRRSQHPETTEN